MINCKSAYEVWNDLIITHEGISQVRRSKIDLLHSQYENFYTLDSEIIDEMLTRFMKITNEFSSLDDVIDNDQKVRKVIRALSITLEVNRLLSRSLVIERRWISPVLLRSQNP